VVQFIIFSLRLLSAYEMVNVKSEITANC